MFVFEKISYSYFDKTPVVCRYINFVKSYAESPPCPQLDVLGFFNICCNVARGASIFPQCLMFMILHHAFAEDAVYTYKHDKVCLSLIYNTATAQVELKFITAHLETTTLFV
jgi:hypothetical protein